MRRALDAQRRSAIAMTHERANFRERDLREVFRAARMRGSRRRPRTMTRAIRRWISEARSGATRRTRARPIRSRFCIGRVTAGSRARADAGSQRPVCPDRGAPSDRGEVTGGGSGATGRAGHDLHCGGGEHGRCGQGVSREGICGRLPPASSIATRGLQGQPAPPWRGRTHDAGGGVTDQSTSAQTGGGDLWVDEDGGWVAPDRYRRIDRTQSWA
jgi:hypothetical protein